MKISVFLWIHFIQCTCKWKSPIGIKTRHMYATSCIKFLKYIIKVLLTMIYIYIDNVKTDNSCEIISIFFSTVKTHYANIQNLHTICHCKGCFFEYLKNITNLDKKPNRLVSHILLPLRWNIGCWLWSKINLHIYIFNSKLMTS